MKVDHGGITLEVRKRRKRDPHYRGYGDHFGAQIIYPCGSHMQTVGFNIETEEEALEKAMQMADQYPECQDYDCKKH